MTMVKTRNAKRLLIKLMTQADNDFMALDFDRMGECEVSRAYEDWNRLILAYENAYAKLPTPKMK